MLQKRSEARSPEGEARAARCASVWRAAACALVVAAATVSGLSPRASADEIAPAIGEDVLVPGDPAMSEAVAKKPGSPETPNPPEPLPPPVWANLGEELDCLVEPQLRVVVSASIQGVVDEVLVDRGDAVEEGQAIAKLESRIEEATVASARARARSTAQIKGAEARFDFESHRLARGKKLSSEGVMSDGELDEIEAGLIVAEADVLSARENKILAELELARAEAALEMRTVRSPLRGVVVEKIAKAGEYVDPPEVLELAQIDPLRIEVFAPVSLFGSLREGMLGRVILEEPVGGEHEVVVTVVDRVIDAASGTFGVRLELPNPDYKLPAGLKCRVKF